MVKKVVAFVAALLFTATFASPVEAAGSPTVSQAILRLDRWPQGVRWGVWGEEGYVEGRFGCSFYSNGVGWVVVGTGAKYFSGGGSSYSAGMQLTGQCPWTRPYIVRGTPVAWSWG